MAVSTPSISVTTLSTTSFSVAVSAAIGTTTAVYQRNLAGGSDTLIGSVVGASGSVTASGLVENASYLVYAVSTDGVDHSLPAIVPGTSLATADTLSGAIIRKYQADPALMTLCPQIWYNEVPEFDPLNDPIRPPFIRLQVPDETPDWTFETSYADVCIGIFTIYAYSSEAADAIGAAVEAAFDWKDVPYDSDSVNVQAMRNKSYGGSDEIRDREGQLVPYRVLEYQFMRTRRQAG